MSVSGGAQQPEVPAQNPQPPASAARAGCSADQPAGDAASGRTTTESVYRSIEIQLPDDMRGSK